MRPVVFALLLSPALAQPAPPLTPEEQAALGAAFDAPPAPVTTPVAPLASANPDIALILDVAAAWFSDDPDQRGGHDPQKTGFNLQQLELHVGHSVDPYFEFATNIVFAQFGVEVEEAYATTLALPHGLQARAGQFLTRMGRLNPTHPHAWAFVDQPLVNGKFFGSEGSRGLGIELSWLSPLPWYAVLYGSTTDAAAECCARSFFGGEDLGVETPADLLHTLRLEQFFPFDDAWSLSWGLNGQLGPNASGNGNRTEIYGTDLYLRWRPTDSPGRVAFSLQTEGFYRTRQVPEGRLEDVGLYSQALLDFARHWQVGGRYEWVQGVEDDPLDPEWTDDRTRISAQATWFPSHFSRLRLQYSIDDGPQPRVQAVMLALETLVGAHGAHGF